MKPKKLIETPSKITIEFIDYLQSQNFDGDFGNTYSDRIVFSTDNSIYQVLPQSILFPKNESDVIKIMKGLSNDEFSSITLSPRGGGTGTNGQSLTDGIIIDLSKYMKDILSHDEENNTTTIQPGVVLDYLNDFLRAKGFFFPPTVSPSSRATIGGMVGTDASGKGSLIYGKTSNHVVSLKCVGIDGNIFETGRKKVSELSEIELKIFNLIKDNDELIKSKFPSLTRFMSGYNLAHVYDKKTDTVDITPLIAGSEGTLCVVTEIKVKATPIPKVKRFVMAKFKSFDGALKSAETILSYSPDACETVDKNILELAKDDNIYNEVKHLISSDDEPDGAINIIEFSGDALEIEKRVEELTTKLHSKKDELNLLRAIRIENGIDAQNLFSLRSKGVGLLGNTKGNRKPIAFVEDTAVPPENLAAYIKEFKELLDNEGVEYAMFGHIDVGCLHVRPKLDTKIDDDIDKIKRISDGVASLVKKYDGLMWAEHGRGYRSGYARDFMGDELYSVMRQVKSIFDKNNKLNPNKIATPVGFEDNLIKVDGIYKGLFDRQIDNETQDRYEKAIACNGNGLCFHYHPDHVMCPSFKVSQDRKYSPKGRAALIREWLRFKDSDVDGLKRFEDEIYDSMNKCLACKACTGTCPVHVDIPDFKAMFIDSYRKKRTRPLKDMLVKSVETTARLSSIFPKLTSIIMNTELTKYFTKKFAGMIDAPTPDYKGIKRLKKLNIPQAKPKNLEKIKDKVNSIILLSDAFTLFYDTGLVADTCELLKKLEIDVYIMPFIPNGKPQHIKGYIDEFKKTAQKNVKALSKISQYEIDIVGIEPSVVLTYEDEYPRAGVDVDFKVKMIEHWMAKHQFDIKLNSNIEYNLFSHCTEKTNLYGSEKMWIDTFRQFNLKIKPVNVGCCGMAGTFGHEIEHYEESKKIYELSWGKKVSKMDTDSILVTGYSCRTQVKRFSGFKPKHPLSELLKILNNKDM